MGCAMEILYQDANILVCIKPARVLSTDEPGGLPELVREALGDPKADVRTVQRRDGAGEKCPRGVGAVPTDSGRPVQQRISGRRPWQTGKSGGDAS